MRDILFRGKRLDNGEWVYGSLLQVEYENGSVVTAIFDRKDSGGDAEINPSTVGQFTGLTDRNGKRIFEGDIVEHVGRRFVVEYINEYCRFAGTRPWICFAHFAFKRCEVIGNIHDNPEFLEGDEEE